MEQIKKSISKSITRKIKIGTNLNIERRNLWKNLMKNIQTGLKKENKMYQCLSQKFVPPEVTLTIVWATEDNILILSFD